MDEKKLRQLYINQKKSVQEISSMLHCSQGKINYWLDAFGIRKRSISEAIYIKHNPQGDPFLPNASRYRKQALLFGIGMGLYWGEGTKKSISSVRLGNTDPYLIRVFLRFLETCYGIDKSKLRFGLQLFTDMNTREEEEFWRRFLNAESSQFYKTINTKSGRVGTYRNKSKHGVLTIYFHNKKLRDTLIEEIEKMKSIR